MILKSRTLLWELFHLVKRSLYCRICVQNQMITETKLVHARPTNVTTDQIHQVLQVITACHFVKLGPLLWLLPFWYCCDNIILLINVLDSVVLVFYFSILIFKNKRRTMLTYRVTSHLFYKRFCSAIDLKLSNRFDSKNYVLSVNFCYFCDWKGFVGDWTFLVTSSHIKKFMRFRIWNRI